MRKALVRYIARGTTCRVTRNKDRPSALKRAKTENPQTTGEGGSPQVKHAQPKTESSQTSREGGSLQVGTCTARDRRRRQSPSGDMHSQRQRAPRPAEKAAGPAEKAAVSNWGHAQPETEDGGSPQVGTCTARDRRRRQSPIGDMHSQRQKTAAVPKWGHAQPKTESPQTSREGGSLQVETCTAKDRESPQTSREGGSLQVETCTAKDRESPQTSREGGSLQVGTCTAKNSEPPDQQRMRRQSPNEGMHNPSNGT